MKVPMNPDTSPEARLFQAVVLQSIADACSLITVTVTPYIRKPRKIKTRGRAKASRRAGPKSLDEWKKANRDGLAEMKRERHERQEARDWLTGGSRAFKDVCSFAGLNPDYVREGALRLAARGWASPSFSLQAHLAKQKQLLAA